MNERGEQYSYGSLINILKENSALQAKILSKKILEDVKTFEGNAVQHDDQTLLILKQK